MALKSGTCGVMLALKKNPTKLANYQEKIHKISDQVGVAISGMTADARVLCKYMRKENLVNKNLHKFDMGVNALASKVSTKFHEKTTTYGKRPFGLGMLMMGFDAGMFLCIK
jgi:20S proteasome subunit alpha 6